MRRGAKVLAWTALAVVMTFIFIRLSTYLFVDDTNSQTRITLHELYTSNENIDVLFLGSSHCMRTIDCSKADKLLNLNTFNCGTSSQQLDGSYAMLVEAGKKNNIKDVWVELYYGQLGRPTNERTQMTATYILSDYMPLSYNKIRFLLLASNPEYYANSFLPVRRSWQNVFEKGYFVNLMNAKLSEQYRNYEYIGSYKGKGFIGSDESVQPGTYSYVDKFWSIEPITNDDKESLQNIMTYCEERNIRLHFFSAPMSDFRLVSLGNYDEYVNEISSYLAQYGYEYYDFNLCKEDYLSLDESDYIDDNHLNSKGADQVTQLICDIMNNNVDVKDIFEDNYATKISTQGNRIYGVQFFPLDNGMKGYKIVPIVNFECEFSYNIQKISADGNVSIIQEASPNDLITLEENETGRIIVDVIVDGAITNSVEVSY